MTGHELMTQVPTACLAFVDEIASQDRGVHPKVEEILRRAPTWIGREYGEVAQFTGSDRAFVLFFETAAGGPDRIHAEGFIERELFSPRGSAIFSGGGDRVGDLAQRVGRARYGSGGVSDGDELEPFSE